MSEPLAVTVNEAARLTAVGRNALYAAINAGELRAVRVGRRIVVPMRALAEWLDQRARLDSPRGDE